jgi:hypothetical protein
MILLHLEIDSAGETYFRTESFSDDDQKGFWASPEQVFQTVCEIVVKREDVFLLDDGRVTTTQRNLLMFFSDIRKRKFKYGIFLGDDVIAARSLFLYAAKLVQNGRCLPSLEVVDSRGYARWRMFSDDELNVPDTLPGAVMFVRRSVDSLMRLSSRSVLEMEEKSYSTLHDAWLAALRNDSGLIKWNDVDELKEFACNINEWQSPLCVSQKERASLVFKLISPLSADGEWLITIPRAPSSRASLISLGQAASLFPPLKYMQGTQGVISIADAENFMRDGAKKLADAGYKIDVPKGILGEHVTAEEDIEELPNSSSSLQRRFEVKTTIRVAGEIVTEAELEFLLAQDSNLVYFRERWIEVDKSILREALRELRATAPKRVNLYDAISLSLGISKQGRLRIAKARAHGWLRGLLNELKGKDTFDLIQPPQGLKATLRDYQLRGVSWLLFLAKYGFGPCLADDMGLGKTIQTIAYILHLKETSRLAGPALIVAPVSVTTNWHREFSRFAPSLKVYLHQGSFRMQGYDFDMRCRKVDVVITGYSLLVKDFKSISSVKFSTLVLDEAQVVKNADTHVSKAARALQVQNRIALTGTPVENSPDDLWSIQAFLNPGLLGDKLEFSKNFTKPIKEDSRSQATAKLKHIIEPFILRRMKTDEGIAAELGEKREVREYCPLSWEQRRLYEDAFTSFKTDLLADIDARSRQGKMLALLTRLKEICDAPELPAGDISVAPTGGKIARLIDLLESIFESGESVLIFTQYARMGRMLRTHLRNVFGRRISFLHGGLTPSARENEINEFNASKEPTAFILSLKAGGFGLNLTKATHVIHYDRWWNPAVENQATDRAHRIGQTKTVFVHTFISPGTLEDHIDTLLESKRLLANEIVTTGESFLMKMSDNEFEKMVRLDG